MQREEPPRVKSTPRGFSLTNIAEMSKAEVAYRESVRAIESQEASIGELRSRTGIAFAAAALSVSVLGSVAFEDGWGFAEWVGVLFLGLMVVALAIIVWPRAWEFRSNGKKIVQAWVDVEDGLTLDDLYRDLAIHITDAHLKNQKVLNRLGWIYAASIVFALGSIVAFASALV